MDDAVIALVNVVRSSLFGAFYEWLEKNKDCIDEGWYRRLVRNGRRAEEIAVRVSGLLGIALWMYNVMSNLGVVASVSPGSYVLRRILNPRMDEDSTRKLLTAISTTLTLQWLLNFKI